MIMTINTKMKYSIQKIECNLTSYDLMKIYRKEYNEYLIKKNRTL